MQQIFKYYLVSLFMVSFPVAIKQAAASELNAEVQRIPKAKTEIPTVTEAFNDIINNSAEAWHKSSSFINAKNIVQQAGEALWHKAKTKVQTQLDYDDRPLYWARLQLQNIVLAEQPGFSMTPSEQATLLQLLEQSSRGRTDLDFTQATDKRILLTGFDPFLLDRNINQSNPSGVAALLLDGMVIEHQGIRAEINTVMVPVRFPDFDKGFVETLLAPYYVNNSVDMVVTVSMGRTNFDLERFPGKRRSALAPDNLNIMSGGNPDSPLIPKLGANLLPGAEFVEFSLPVKQMKSAKGAYKINDNHKVTTLNKSFKPINLHQLNGEIAVSGSGGGYLSNEISYRSIRLQRQLKSNIPTGHIHTPRIAQFEPKATKAIIQQIENMLRLALSEL